MKPRVSVVVVVYNMHREAPRTLYSLSASYQLDILPRDYEVIVVDNGSNPPLDPNVVARLEGNFRLIRIDPAPPSPAHALNRGLSEARGDVIGVMVDGARIATPRLLHFAWSGAKLYERAVVTTAGYYIGSDYQAFAALAGYDAKAEDALLETIEWPKDGYRLFDISTLDESWPEGWLGAVNPARLFESNAIFANRESWKLVGGVDERFVHPGGGLVNHDIYRRLIELPMARLVMVLGDATFHQYHGGVATNADPEHFPERFELWKDEYRALRGRELGSEPELGSHPTTYVGTMRSAETRRAKKFTWGGSRPSLPSDPTLAELVKLMRMEFEQQRYENVVAIARMMRARSKDEPEPLRLLRLLAPHEDPRHRRPHDARFHVSVGKAHVLLGEPALAAKQFRAALALEPECNEAHRELAKCSSLSASC